MCIYIYIDIERERERERDHTRASIPCILRDQQLGDSRCLARSRAMRRRTTTAVSFDFHKLSCLQFPSRLCTIFTTTVSSIFTNSRYTMPVSRILRRLSQTSCGPLSQTRRHIGRLTIINNNSNSNDNDNSNSGNSNMPIMIIILIMIIMGDCQLSWDVMTFGSSPIRWLLFDMRSLKNNHPMRKMVDGNHIT